MTPKELADYWEALNAYCASPEFTKKEFRNRKDTLTNWYKRLDLSGQSEYHLILWQRYSQ